MTFMKEKASISLVSTLIIRVILIREKGRAKALWYMRMETNIVENGKMTKDMVREYINKKTKNIFCRVFGKMIILFKENGY